MHVDTPALIRRIHDRLTELVPVYGDNSIVRITERAEGGFAVKITTVICSAQHVTEAELVRPELLAAAIEGWAAVANDFFRQGASPSRVWLLEEIEPHEAGTLRGVFRDPEAAMAAGGGARDAWTSTDGVAGFKRVITTNGHPLWSRWHYWIVYPQDVT